MEKKIEDTINIFIEFLMNNKQQLIMESQDINMALSDNARADILKLFEDDLKGRGFDTVEASLSKKMFLCKMWGYDVLENLIEDVNLGDDQISSDFITDIKCYNENNIWIKRKGRREKSSVGFLNRKDYERFVNLVAVKNKVSISKANSIQNFGDITSSKNFILRINITTEYVNQSQCPVLYIRKIPKFKFALEDLVKEAFLTSEQYEYVCNRIINSSGILVVGKGASGKTTFINAMIEKIPEGSSAMVIQEIDELHSKENENIDFKHPVESKGEDKIKHTYRDLAVNGLKTDVDYYILGEITGDEAAEFSIASYTGHICWSSVHGLNEVNGIKKLSDYSRRATGYSYKETNEMLVGIEDIFYIKDWQLNSISINKGVDSEGNLQIEKVDIATPEKRIKVTDKKIMSEIEKYLLL